MTKSIKYSFILAVVLLLNSCSEYNTVLNKGTNPERYELANKLYQDGDFDKAIRMYELVLSSYAVKPQGEVIVFRLANANFQSKDYVTAVYYYERFLRNYDKSTELETAQFNIAESYFQLSPKYSVDQTDTNKAIAAYQNFIDNNPDSKRIDEANNRIKELNYKLEKKSFEIAKQYYKIGNYKSAIKAFDNVMLDFLGTNLKEEAMFFKLKSAYELGMNSVLSKKEARIKEAIKIYLRFNKTYPASEYAKEAKKLFDKLSDEKVV